MIQNESKDHVHMQVIDKNDPKNVSEYCARYQWYTEQRLSNHAKVVFSIDQDYFYLRFKLSYWMIKKGLPFASLHENYL